jgi:hypothetical protein
LVEPDCLIVITNRLVEVTTEGIDVSPIVVEQAAVDTAQANLVLAQAHVRGLIGQARSNRFKLAHAIEDVDNPGSTAHLTTGSFSGACRPAEGLDSDNRVKKGDVLVELDPNPYQ